MGLTPAFERGSDPVSPCLRACRRRVPRGRAARDRVSGERHRAGVAALVLPLGQHARRRADARGQGRHAAPAGGARGAGAAHDGRPEGLQPRRQLGRAVAAAAQPRPHQARSEAVPHRGRRTARRDAHGDDACSSRRIIKEDRSLLDFIDAPFTFVNGPLARHYGIKGVDGEEFQRVTLDGEQRSGVLTQGAILTVSSYPTRTSPPVRGKWVMENLLGTPPPPPPDDVPSLNESNIGTEVSLRERLEQHRRDPSCSPCHMLMDPLGFGLENYDAVGAWRTHDGKFPIETSGTLPGRQTFTGSKGLKEILQGQVRRVRAQRHREAADLQPWARARALRSSHRRGDQPPGRRRATTGFRRSSWKS